MTKEEATRIIAEKVAAAAALIRECEQIADQHDVCFDFSVAYGMGGSYYPDDNGWYSSSQDC